MELKLTKDSIRRLQIRRANSVRRAPTIIKLVNTQEATFFVPILIQLAENVCFSDLPDKFETRSSGFQQ